MAKKRMYNSAAEKQAAYRERQADIKDEADFALFLYKNPTFKFIKAIAKKIVSKSEHPNLTAALVLDAVREGVALGLATKPAENKTNQGQIDMDEWWEKNPQGDQP